MGDGATATTVLQATAGTEWRGDAVDGPNNWKDRPGGGTGRVTGGGTGRVTGGGTGRVTGGGTGIATDAAVGADSVAFVEGSLGANLL